MDLRNQSALLPQSALERCLARVVDARQNEGDVLKELYGAWAPSALCRRLTRLALLRSGGRRPPLARRSCRRRRSSALCSLCTRTARGRWRRDVAQPFGRERQPLVKRTRFAAVVHIDLWHHIAVRLAATRRYDLSGPHDAQFLFHLETAAHSAVLTDALWRRRAIGGPRAASATTS